MMDARIGKHGGDAPGVCAVTRQECAGQHATHYSIGNGHYIAILEKAHMRMNASDIEVVKDECRKLMSGSGRASKVAPMKKAEE